MTAVYLHIPFCRSKCPYCDFYSVAIAGEGLGDYPDLLLRHIDITARKGLGEKPLETVFFGGGTPSLLSFRDVGRILDRLEARFGLESDAEISMEANPGTISPAILGEYRRTGINRISLGIQSVSDEHLRFLGRFHSAAEARAAAADVHRAGFENVAFDLMFGLPGQTLPSWRREIDELLQMEPVHISCYGLTVEDQTPFHHIHRSGGFALPDDDAFADLFLATHHILTEAGFDHYEISNFSRPGRKCRHNMNYWRRGPYLGFGAGAHSFFTREWGERRAVPDSLETFRRELEAGRDPALQLERLTIRQAMAETLFLGLRCREGVSEKEFRSRFGSGVAAAFPHAVSRAGSHFRLEEGRWTLDVEGWLIFNLLLEPFLNEEMNTQHREEP